MLSSVGATNNWRSISSSRSCDAEGISSVRNGKRSRGSLNAGITCKLYSILLFLNNINNIWIPRYSFIFKTTCLHCVVSAAAIESVPPFNIPKSAFPTVVVSVAGPVITKDEKSSLSWNQMRHLMRSKMVLNRSKMI